MYRILQDVMLYSATVFEVNLIRKAKNTHIWVDENALLLLLQMHNIYSIISDELSIQDNLDSDLILRCSMR